MKPFSSDGLSNLTFMKKEKRSELANTFPALSECKEDSKDSRDEIRDAVAGD